MQRIKQLLLAVATACLVCFLAAPVQAQALIAVDEENFPDEVFRSYVSEKLDTNYDGVLSGSEIEKVTAIRVRYGMIESLKGIEYFVNLTNLDCAYNSLTELDLSANTKLEILQFGHNQIARIDLSSNLALMHIYCENNLLTQLDISSLLALASLDCSSNPLTQIDVSSNERLANLWCSDTQIQTLDVSNNTELIVLHCRDNELKTLDVTKNVKLESLDCSGNSLASLELGNMQCSWFELLCQRNQIIIEEPGDPLSMDAVTGFDPDRIVSWIGGTYDPDTNSVSGIQGPAVGFVYDCGGGAFMRVTLQLETEPIPVDELHFPDPAFRSFVQSCLDENQDGFLNLTERSGVETIEVDGLDIVTLKGIEYFSNLIYLNCSNNIIGELELGFSYLEELHCSINAISTLDLEGQLFLHEFSIAYNPVRELDFSDVQGGLWACCIDCPELTTVTLNHSENALYEFSRSGLTQLTVPVAFGTMPAVDGCGSLEEIVFAGDKPGFSADSFTGVTAKAWYSVNNDFWTEADLQNYGGTITWIPDCKGNHQIQYHIDAEPTATEKGGLKAVCAVCKEESQIEIPAWNETDYTQSVQQTATCTATGKATMTWKETQYGIYSFEIVIPALAHDMAVSEVRPTCTEPGKTVETCGVCGHEEETEIVPALGHDFGQWTVSKDATVDAEGEKVRACTRCDETETERIPKLEPPKETEPEETEPEVTVPEETKPNEKPTEPEEEEWVNPFLDVAEDKFYYEPVLWAYYGGITTGKDATHFNPSGNCTRSQVVTFLWRAAGQPEPASSENPFPDVPDGKFYTKAVLWAVEQGITAGFKDGTFGPNKSCTRAQIVTFLWRYFGEPNPTSLNNPFPDVAESKFYYRAVLWAVENEITGGFKDGTFGPNKTCTRDQIVTFLYRAMVQ